MHRFAVLSLLALAACGQQSDTNRNGSMPRAVNAAAPAQLSADQKAAQAVASRYLAHLSAGEFKEARALWDDDGAASGGSAADLKRAYDGYAAWAGRAGEVSEISRSTGRQNVIVTAYASATRKRTGETRDMNGFVYLRRPNDRAAWRIWGVDIRRRN